MVAASCPHRYTLAAMKSCIETARRVYVAAWTRELAAEGLTSVKVPRVVFFAGPVKNPCLDLTAGDVAEASFWCGKNSTVYVSLTAAPYWTTNYARAAATRKVLASDAVAAGTSAADLKGGYPLVGATTEFAHELGHWVQQVTGQMAWYDARVKSSDFTVSNKAQSSAELAADCFAGWIQGRTAADGTWVDTAIGRWAHHATMAELGGDVDAVSKGFVFPPEKPADIIGYGSAYTRIKLYDGGQAAGRAGKPGVATCSGGVATYLHADAPPLP